MTGGHLPSTSPWPLRAVPPHTAGWSWSLYAPSDLSRARSALRTHLRGVGRDVLGATDMAEAAERVLLAADEMASNGVRHGRLPVTLTLCHQLDTGCWLLTVTDAAPDRGPRPDPGRDPALGGLGLSIIATFAHAHGWWRGPSSKTVRAELPTDV